MLSKIWLYYCPMTTVINTPTRRAQDIVAMNVNLMITARRLPKKDFAKALGLAPQTIARKLRSEITWTIDETQAAADYLKTDVATLLNPSLTSDDLLGINTTDDPNDGGQRASKNETVPWTGGL